MSPAPQGLRPNCPVVLQELHQPLVITMSPATQGLRHNHYGNHKKRYELSQTANHLYREIYLQLIRVNHIPKFHQYKKQIICSDSNNIIMFAVRSFISNTHSIEFYHHSLFGDKVFNNLECRFDEFIRRLICFKVLKAFKDFKEVEKSSWGYYEFLCRFIFEDNF